MSIEIIKIKQKRPKPQTHLQEVKIIYKDDSEIKVIEKSLMIILEKRGLDINTFSKSDLYKCPNKNRLIEVIYGRIAGYNVVKGENQFDDVKIIPNNEKMNLSKLTCNYNRETNSLTITDGIYTYCYNVDENCIISENGEQLPKQEYIPTFEEVVQKYRENEEWDRDHNAKLNKSLIKSRNVLYK